MCSNNNLLVVCLPFILLCVVSGSDDWGNCPSICSGFLYGSMKAADCQNSSLKILSGSLDPEIKVLNLSLNNFVKLLAYTFQQMGLMNLEIIYLKECQIEEIDKDAFGGLKHAKELYLSANNIHSIHPDTFIETVKLRTLDMSGNPIEVLENRVFRTLKYLDIANFANCNISRIEPETFHGVRNLQVLDLRGNQLTNIQLSLVESLTELKTLGLEDNPWRCDCQLREFQNWTISREFYTRHTTCAEPSDLRSTYWDSDDHEKLACEQKILYPPPGTRIKASGENVTLSCKVYGYPLPSVRWEYKSLVIDDNTPIPRYEVKSSNPNGRKDELWLNLTISNIRSADKGEYFCVINYLGGKEERIVNLDI